MPLWCRVIVGWCVAVAAGCYDPDLIDCRVRCAQADDCAGSQVCDEDGWCAAPEVAGRCAAVQDARVDAPPQIDAGPSLCELGCSNGTCDGDVCVIDCSAPGSCPTDVRCPINLPCRVVCGPNACGDHILCEMSTSCDIQCLGDGSCRDEIRCGTGPCDVACTGDDSCPRRIKCKDACSCDVTCTGASTCLEAPECPADECRLGNGCTSQVAGCNDC